MVAWLPLVGDFPHAGGGSADSILSMTTFSWTLSCNAWSRSQASPVMLIMRPALCWARLRKMSYRIRRKLKNSEAPLVTFSISNGAYHLASNCTNSIRPAFWPSPSRTLSCACIAAMRKAMTPSPQSRRGTLSRHGQNDCRVQHLAHQSHCAVLHVDVEIAVEVEKDAAALNKPLKTQATS